MSTINHPASSNEFNPDVVGIILAGGFGTRLQSVQSACPKPLIPCLGQPFIEWVLLKFQQAGLRRFVVSLGHLANVAEQHFLKRSPAGLEIVTVVESHPLGTAGAVKFAWQQIPDRSVLVLNGDSLLLADFTPVWKIWAESSAEALVVGVPQSDASRYGTLTFTPLNRLVGFEEKRPGQGVINAGIYLFRPSLLKTFPIESPASLERDVFPKWLQQKREIHVCVLEGPFLDIGLPESLATADDFLLKHWQEPPSS